MSELRAEANDFLTVSWKLRLIVPNHPAFITQRPSRRVVAFVLSCSSYCLNSESLTGHTEDAAAT